MCPSISRTVLQDSLDSLKWSKCLNYFQTFGDLCPIAIQSYVRFGTNINVLNGITKERSTISYQKLKNNLSKNLPNLCAQSENYIFRHQITANSEEKQIKFWVKFIFTGCPKSKFPLCFGCFLGFPCSYRGSFYHFSTAQETTIPKLTFLPTSKIDQVTEQNLRQTGFRYYFFGTYKVYLNCI